jgi:pimeloyl-ACP methyl ester carboxylesterase
VAALRATPFWPLFVADGEPSVREWPALTYLDFDASAFSGLHVPTLLITGGNSPDIYLTKEIADALPKSQVVTLEGQEHIAQALAPQLFADTVKSFVNEHATVR